jgi:hypothetical protein
VICNNEGRAAEGAALCFCCIENICEARGPHRTICPRLRAFGQSLFTCDRIVSEANVTSVLRQGLRAIAAVMLFAVCAMAQASTYYIRVSGSPGTITCTDTNYTFSQALTLSWNFAPGATAILDGALYINGGW